MGGDFVLVTSLGHSGSKWLAKALSMPKRGLRVFHEKARKMFPKENTFCENMRHQFERGDVTVYEPYFQSIRDALENYRTVGDSHAWFYWGLDTVVQYLQVKRAVHLVRNGITVVGSYVSGFKEIGVQASFWQDRFRWYWQTRRADSAPKHWSMFEKVCFIWDSCQSLVPAKLDNLLDPGGVRVVRLEDVSGQPGELVRLARWLSPGLVVNKEHLAAIATQDHNRHTGWYTDGERSPRAYWQRWTKEERLAFERQCGSTMRQYGYNFEKAT